MAADAPNFWRRFEGACGALAAVVTATTLPDGRPRHGAVKMRAADLHTLAAGIPLLLTDLLAARAGRRPAGP